MFASRFSRSMAGAVALLQLTAAHAQQPSTRISAAASATFNFKVCNLRTFIVSVAVKYNSDGANFITHGWWHIQPRTCQEISDFRQGDFYVFAQTFNLNPVQVFVVGSDLAKFCVIEKVNFTYSGTRTCNEAEYRDFSHLVVSTSTVTWNL
jgi:uncharacterized membrane protein